jgi:hypothetical protein
MVMVRRDRALAFMVVLALAWLGLVAYMTSDGFSGNQRYLIAPVALLIVLGGAGAGWALGRVLALARTAIPGVVGRRVGHAVVLAVALAVGIGFAAPSFQRFEPTMHSLAYQGHLADELPGLVRDAGGAAALRRCGDPYTGPFLVPVVAWNLHLHTQDVRLDPRSPAVVFRVKTTTNSRSIPALGAVGAGDTLATGARWRIVGACGSGRR